MRKIAIALCLFLGVALTAYAQNPVVRSADAAGSDDRLLVGDGTNYVGKTLPSCSNATTSKLLYNNTTNAFSCGTDQSGAGGFDPLDMTVNYVREDFPNHATATGTVGTHGWVSSCASGTVAHAAATTPNFGLVRLTTGATSTNLCTIYLGYTSTSDTSFGVLSAYTFDSKFRFQQHTSETTSTRLYVGFLAGTSTASATTGFAQGCYARFDTALVPPDTTWKVVCDNSNGGDNVFDTSEAPDTDYHTLRVRSTSAGTILVQFDATAEQTYSAALPTNHTKPQFYVETATTAARNFQAEFFAWTTTGLSR